VYGALTDPSAQLTYPYGLLLGPDGRPWFHYGGLHSIAPDGTLVTHTDPHGDAITTDPLRSPDGALWVPDYTGMVRFGADGQPHEVATWPGQLDSWGETSDNRVVVFSYVRTTKTAMISWIDAAGTVVSYTLSGGISAMLLSDILPGPDGSVWGYSSAASAWVGYLPDGSMVPVQFPTGATLDYWMPTPGLPLYATYTLNGASVLASVDTTGALQPVLPDAAWRRVAGDQLFWASDSGSGHGVLHRAEDPSWSATLPMALKDIRGVCWQPSTSSVWMSTYNTTGTDNTGTVYQVTSTGSTVRLSGAYFPYDFGSCHTAPDGSLWSTIGANIAFSEYFHVSGDGRSVAFNGFGPNSSGPAVVSNDGDVWMPVASDTPDSATAAIGHLGYVATSRTSGSDRLEGAANVAAAAFPHGAPVVYLASGSDFPDALAAGPTAAHDGGPLLLVTQGVLPTSTGQELARLAPSRVVLVGGANAIGSAVEQSVRSLLPGATVQRLSGADRFATGRAVVSSAFSTASHVYIATGGAFPDALSASAAAGSQNAPVVLVDGRQATLDAATRSFVAGLKPSSITIVGGTSAVSDGILRDLDTLAPTSRISGSDRFETSASVARTVFGNATRAFLANGLNFPDALTGAVWAATTGSPLLTVAPQCVPTSTETALLDSNIRSATLLGGTAALGGQLDTMTACASG
jgi:putative cell wall-binding protein